MGQQPPGQAVTEPAQTVNHAHDPPYRWSRIRSVITHDVPASCVVFLVAVPLSLGIAVASGAPLMAGLVAAVVGGVLVGLLGGSAVQVSGPAAGLTVIVAELVQTYGWRATCAITLMAGLLQLTLGLLRVARTALAVSPSVVHGMLAGVGVVIVLAQLHVALGGSPQSSAVANLRELPEQLVRNHTPAVAVGLLTIVVLLLWARVPHRLRSVPAPLVAVVIATAISLLAGWNVERVDLPSSITTWTGPLWPDGDWQQIAGAVIAVALVAGVESLLCTVAMDRQHRGPRADLNRELAAQGIGNTVSGALCGLPVAGVVVRSTVNVHAGARSRWSTVMHGTWILLFTLTLSSVIDLIPLAALAAILVFIGVQMINLGHIRNLHQHREAPVYLVTLLGVVVFGLAEGVLVGLAVAGVVALRRLARVSIRVEQRDDGRHVTVSGSLTFFGVPRLVAALQSIPPGTHVDLDLNVDFMDHGAFEALHDWRLTHERSGGAVDIHEIHDSWYERRTSGDTGPPVKVPPAIPERWWLPRSDRRRRHRRGLTSAQADLLAGTREYQTRTAPLLQPILTRMIRKQEPSHLFITCADSRLVPNIMTASGPGDLFTVRNVGNLVPRYGSETADHSVAAAVEYAVSVLRVRAITICGHSGCGAMGALMSGGEKTAELTELTRWLEHGHHSLARYLDSPGPDTLDRLCQINVLQQLDNLRSYPVVADLEERGELELVGLYFDLATARVHVVDHETPRGEPALPSIGG
ncbi:bifunctional SulP family inorganic anion transporter/carbonic anhydrase [Rhizohabitans arisaemae]|uniref:bifunctional SulP family inorganic anion transporter/carbonic anhydrase n=1 Tax=Rhizohabitans arisaemae TaxID=2720610 RepID=UPI0024B0926A|nr:bifunctional SulP family inorganic anion transporter/carbonic anhydrase [Rhizohabitans arisaemae]